MSNIEIEYKHEHLPTLIAPPGYPACSFPNAARLSDTKDLCGILLGQVCLTDVLRNCDHQSRANEYEDSRLLPVQNLDRETRFEALDFIMPSLSVP